MIGVSACLGGELCRYDGSSKTIPQLAELIAQGQARAVCPEVLGGLPIPRDPAEIKGGDGFDVWTGRASVITNRGEDVTESFKKGAIQAYEVLIAAGIDRLIMKEKSPSCGSKWLYDGSFSGQLKKGVGVATAYFTIKGLKIFSEADWEQAISAGVFDE